MSRRKRVIGGIEDDVLVIGGLAAAAWFLVIKPLVPTWGATAAQAASINSADTAVATNNPFNNQYQPFQDWFADQGFSIVPESGVTTVASLTEYMASLKQIYDSLDPVPAVNFANGQGVNIAIVAEQIYSAFGFFHFVGSYAAITAAFAQYTSKIQVAATDAYLVVNYGVSLWSWLKNGSATSFSGLHADQLAAIVDHVNTLPEGD